MQTRRSVPAGTLRSHFDPLPLSTRLGAKEGIRSIQALSIQGKAFHRTRFQTAIGIVAGESCEVFLREHFRRLEFLALDPLTQRESQPLYAKLQKCSCRNTVENCVGRSTCWGALSRKFPTLSSSAGIAPTSMACSTPNQRHCGPLSSNYGGLFLFWCTVRLGLAIPAGSRLHFSVRCATSYHLGPTWPLLMTVLGPD